MELTDVLNATHTGRLWDAFVRRRSNAFPMYWFTAGLTNFGDMLSPAVVQWVSDNRRTCVTDGYARNLLAAGSIIQRSHAAVDRVWGSCLIRDAQMSPPDDAQFLAVRGPLTTRCIQADVPQVYRDPALLLPRF